jgi:predicted ATPase/DNA-binding CsgD family transcriptional regulator
VARRSRSIAKSAERPHTGPMDSVPAQLTSFVGRASTIELVKKRLGEHRLVSLVGPGGCGKTRLAIEVARHGVGSTPQDCVVFVDFSGLSDPALVPGAVTRALGLREVPGQDPLETLSSQLSKRELLLLLDNCEHLLQACAALAGAMARGCPGVRLLATSRERLAAPGEAVVTVGGLELPDRADPCEGWVERSEAGRLFIDRARMARADFVVDPAALATICERLDGIPLALELAAARSRMMSVGAIAEALSDRFHLLVAREEAGAARHKTLLASLEWSCGLLSENERRLLHRLSVFASGFTLPAATAVASGGQIEQGEILRLLTALVDKSLVEALPSADRFRLHETMRAYAVEGLEACGATAAVRDRHLDYFSALTKSMGPSSLTSKLYGELVAVSPELDNLRAALDWAVESKQFDAGAKLLGSAGIFFLNMGIDSEGLARCEQLLAVELEATRRADVLHLASSYTVSSDFPASMSYASELIELGRSLGDDRIVARGLSRAAYIQAFTKPDEGRIIAKEAVRLAQTTGQQHILVESLTNEAWAYVWLARPEEAFAVAEKAVSIAQELDLVWGESSARQALSRAARFTGRLERSLEEARTLLKRSTHLPGLFAYIGQAHFGSAYMYLGDPRALDAYARARCEAETLGHEDRAAEFQCLQGQLFVSRGQQDEGYKIIEEGIARLERRGRSRTCVNDRAVLAEVALWRGDLALAQLNLDATSSQVPARSEPEAVPVLRVEARLARAEGELHRAHTLACEGLDAAFRGGHLAWAIDLLELVGVTVADLENFGEAARLLGAAEHQREVTNYARWALAREELAPVVVEIEAALGKDLFDQALAEGRGLDLEDAVAYACRGRGSRNRAVSGWESLTPSERRVADLVGQHLSNAEIAERLFVSTTTVKSHLNRAFGKLGVTSRAQLAAAVHGRRASGASERREG